MEIKRETINKNRQNRHKCQLKYYSSEIDRERSIDNRSSWLLLLLLLFLFSWLVIVVTFDGIISLRFVSFQFIQVQFISFWLVCLRNVIGIEISAK